MIASLNMWDESENKALEIIAETARVYGTDKRRNWIRAMEEHPFEVAVIGERTPRAISKRWSTYMRIKEGLCARHGCLAKPSKGTLLCKKHRVENVKTACKRTKNLRERGFLV